MEEAIKHCTKGIGIWDWASSDQDGHTDLVMAAAGDVPTMEALAATEILQQRFPDLGIRFLNVIDIMRLQDDREHPHGSPTPSSCPCSPRTRRSSAAHVRQELVDKIIDHKHYIRRHGEDMPEIAGWLWPMSAEEEPPVPAGPAGVLATAGDNE